MPEPIRREIPADPNYRGETFRRIFMRTKPILRVEKLGLCWEWQGTRNKAGYGLTSVKVNGSGRKIMGAHRILKALNDDLIAIPAMECHHLCTNSPCCNPDHLVWMPAGNHRIWEETQLKLNAGKRVKLKSIARATRMSEGAAKSLLLSMGASENLLV